jgi:hypothetical protein
MSANWISGDKINYKSGLINIPSTAHTLSIAVGNTPSDIQYQSHYPPDSVYLGVYSITLSIPLLPNQSNNTYQQ